MSNSQDRDFLEKADMFSDFHEAGSDKEREQVLKSAREIVREGVYAKGGDIGGVINNEKRADMLVSHPNKIKVINSMIKEKGLTLVYYRMSGTWSTHSLKHPELIVTANPFWEGENDTLTMELAEDGVGDILEEKTIEMPLNLRSSQFIDWYFNQVKRFFDESSTRDGVYAKGGDIGGVINNEKRADMLVSSPNKIKAINSMIREKGLTLVYYRMSGSWSTHSLKHPELIVTANPFWEGENDTLTMELAEDGVGDILEEKTIEMPLNLHSSQFIDWYFNQVNLFFDESSTRDGVYAEGGALFNQNQKNSHISVYIPEQDEFYSVEEIRIQDEDDVLDAGHPYLVLGEPQITYNDLFAKRTGTYAKGGVLYGVEYKEKPTDRKFKKTSLQMANKEAIVKNANLLKKQEGWSEIRIVEEKYAKGGNTMSKLEKLLDDKGITKSEWSSMTAFERTNVVGKENYTRAIPFAKGGKTDDDGLKWWTVKLKMPNGEVVYEDVIAEDKDAAEYYGELTDSAEEGGSVLNVEFKGTETYAKGGKVRTFNSADDYEKYLRKKGKPLDSVVIELERGRKEEFIQDYYDSSGKQITYRSKEGNQLEIENSNRYEKGFGDSKIWLEEGVYTPYKDLPEIRQRTFPYAKGGKTNFETPKHFSSFLVDDVRTQLKKQGYSEAKINKAFQGVNVWMSKDRVPAGVAQANIVDAKGLLDNLPTEDFRELTMNVPITIKVEDPQYDSSGKQILYAKGGEVKKKGNEMLIGGLAGVLIGIFLGK